MIYRSIVLSIAFIALALSTGGVKAQAIVVNQAVTEAEVMAAQKAWCNALVDIGSVHAAKGQPAAKALAEKVIDGAYGYTPNPPKPENSGAL
jgi:hypothetical protein